MERSNRLHQGLVQRLGEAGLNILNMDAQEETSRIIIVVEDSEDSIGKAIITIHDEISKINFV